jgi:hypothetical protein
MHESTITPTTRQGHWPWHWLLLGIAIAVIVAGSVLAVYASSRAHPAPRSVAQSIATAADVEEQFGIRVARLTMTAEGGLIDLRFHVVDASKAVQLLKEQYVPVLIAEDSRVEVKSPAPPDQDTLLAGHTYYILYPNVHGQIQRGTQMTMVIGNLRLEHLVVQ